MAYKINGTTVVDNSRNVCACCVTSCCVTASTKLDAPSGNTASRPGSPATGSIYFDTDEGSLVAYNGTDWASVGGGGWPQVAAHCTAMPYICSATIPDRGGKVPVSYNSVVESITSSYKTSGNYSSTIFVTLKPNGTILEFPNISPGGSAAGIQQWQGGHAYMPTDKSSYSFSVGGESSYCCWTKMFLFTQDKIYKAQQCNKSSGTSQFGFLGLFKGGTRVVATHLNGEVFVWCCDGTCICHTRICRYNNSFSGAMNMFETCSGDLGLLMSNGCHIVHFDLDTYSVTGEWCYTPLETLDHGQSAVTQTDSLAAWAGCCKWGYLWNKETCCLYKVCTSNSGSQFATDARPTMQAINGDIYFKSFACGSSTCYSKFEKVTPTGTRNCYLQVCANPGYIWSSGQHRFTTQNLGEKLITISGYAEGGAINTYASNTDVSISHTGFKCNVFCCAIRWSSGAMNCTAVVADSFGILSPCYGTTSPSCCLCCCLLISCYLCT